MPQTLFKPSQKCSHHHTLRQQYLLIHYQLYETVLPLPVWSKISLYNPNFFLIIKTILRVQSYACLLISKSYCFQWSLISGIYAFDFILNVFSWLPPVGTTDMSLLDYSYNSTQHFHLPIVAFYIFYTSTLYLRTSDLKEIKNNSHLFIFNKHRVKTIYIKYICRKFER